MLTENLAGSLLVFREIRSTLFGTLLLRNLFLQFLTLFTKLCSGELHFTASRKNNFRKSRQL